MMWYTTPEVRFWGVFWARYLLICWRFFGNLLTIVGRCVEDCLDDFWTTFFDEFWTVCVRLFWLLFYDVWTSCWTVCWRFVWRFCTVFIRFVYDLLDDVYDYWTIVSSKINQTSSKHLPKIAQEFVGRQAGRHRAGVVFLSFLGFLEKGGGPSGDRLGIVWGPGHVLAWF